MINIAVAQSGGPTCAINASLAGVFSQAKESDKIDKIFGAKNGIQGVLNNNLIDISEHLLNNDDVELLIHTPSTALGSCRLRLPDYKIDSEPYEKIRRVFEQNNIGAFFYIGGNDSMDTVAKLTKYFAEKNVDIKIVGIPKTIDNDLRATDHTPGFGSAAKYIATSMQEIIRDSSVYYLDSVTIIEIMGRDAGWLTASSGILSAIGEDAPHLIYLPEVPFSIEQFIADIKEVHKTHKSIVCAVSEGLRTAEGKYIAESFLSGEVDVFGHKYLSGLGSFLENVVKDEFDCKVRSIELNVLQRCASHIASKTDLDESFQIGKAAVAAALNGLTGEMMTFERVSDNPYRIEIKSAKIDGVANAEKKMPLSWINESHNGITQKAIDYILPLIQGEVELKYKHGIPVHFKF